MKKRIFLSVLFFCISQVNFAQGGLLKVQKPFDSINNVLMEEYYVYKDNPIRNGWVVLVSVIAVMGCCR